MSRREYDQSKYIDRLDPDFYAIVMAAMRRADTENLRMLQNCWPGVWMELQMRYNAPGGVLTGDPGWATDTPASADPPSENPSF